MNFSDMTNDQLHAMEESLVETLCKQEVPDRETVQKLWALRDYLYEDPYC